MRKYIVFVLALISLPLVAQPESGKFDFRFGTGLTLMGSGDMVTVNFENELNYKVNKYLTGALAINYGRSNYGVGTTTSFYQANANLLLSPFKNSRKNDFRVGGGVSLMNATHAYQSYLYWENGVLVDEDYTFQFTNTVGFNVIIENTYRISDKIMLGLKLYTQPFRSGDINSGALLKLGFAI